MAQVTTPLQQEIEWQLDWSCREWERLPEVEGSIDTWDVVDQIRFVEEWTLEEERLQRLAVYADEGAMTPHQRARYEGLQRLIQRNRPIIRRLQGS